MRKQTELRLIAIIIYLLMILWMEVCTSSCSVTEEPFPIIIQKRDIVFHLWRREPVDVWYHNGWDDSGWILDLWCVDDTGLEHCVVGIGEICVDGEYVRLE